MWVAGNYSPRRLCSAWTMGSLLMNPILFPAEMQNASLLDAGDTKGGQCHIFARMWQQGLVERTSLAVKRTWTQVLLPLPLSCSVALRLSTPLWGSLAWLIFVMGLTIPTLNLWGHCAVNQMAIARPAETAGMPSCSRSQSGWHLGAP